MQLANGQVILHSCDEQTLLYNYHDMVDCDVRKTSVTSQQRMAKPRNVSDPKILLHESKTLPLKRLLKSEGYLAGIALELSSMLLAGKALCPEMTVCQGCISAGISQRKDAFNAFTLNGRLGIITLVRGLTILFQADWWH